MALDLSGLLKRPAGSATKPQALPMGDYPGIVKSYEIDNKNKNNTPYVRFQIGLLGWPDSVPADERGQKNAETGEFHPTDLSKRGLRRDYYLTEDAMWRLDEFLKSCGLPAGAAYDELLPQVVGMNVMVEVQHYVNQQTSEVGNQVGKLIGQG